MRVSAERTCRVDNNESDNYSDKIGESSEISLGKKKEEIGKVIGKGHGE